MELDIYQLIQCMHSIRRRKQLKKNIVKSICFVTIFVLILLVLSNIFKPKNYLKEYGMHYPKANGILGERENSIDIVVIGDSESYRAIIPMKLWKDYGFTTYLCGTPEQSLSVSYSFLKKALKKQSPKIVILEVDNFYIDSKLVDPVKSLIYEVFPIIEYHNRWKSLNNDDLFKKVKYTGIEDMKGYEYSTDVEPIDTEDEEAVEDLNVMYFKLINEYCNKHNAKLILVCAPQTEDWNYARHNAVDKLAKEANVDFIDMNVIDEIDIDWDTETSDGGVHVNYKGGKKATKYLGDYLKNLNILDDHREDEEYKSWNNALKKFKKLTDDDKLGM